MAFTHGSDEWPTKLFKMRGFGHVDVRYDGSRDSMIVVLAGRGSAAPIGGLQAP